MGHVYSGEPGVDSVPLGLLIVTPSDDPLAYFWLIQLAVAAVTSKGAGQAQIDVSLQGKCVLTGAKMRSQKRKLEKGLGLHIL